MTDPPEPPVEETAAAPDPRTGPAAQGAELRTFLIADIRGYTTYTREHGDEAGAALANRFAELVAEVVPAHDGFLLELRGDEALVAFVSARKALRAAIDLQARFKAAELPRGVGIGLDAGEAIPVGDGYRGTSLNLAARLCAAAGPGETLASEAVIHLAAKMDGIAYIEARALKLKGYTDSVRVVGVVPSDLARGRRIASGNGARGLERRGVLVAGVVLVVVALVVGALGSGLLGNKGPAASASPTSAVPTSSPDPLGGAALPVLAFFDAETGALKATTPMKEPTNIAFFSAGSFWLVSESPRVLNRIDLVAHVIAQTIPVPLNESNGFAIDDDAIWVTDLAGPHVVRLDKRTGVVSDYHFGKDAADTAPAVDVVVGGGSVWLSRPDVPEIVRLDATNGTVQARIPVSAFGVNYGADGLWYQDGGRIGRIDPVTDEPAFEPLLLSTTGFLGNIHFGGGDAWAAETGSGQVWRVDRSGRQTSFALQPGVGEMAATDRTMWVSNASTGKVTGIDLVTGRPDLAIDTGHATLAVVAGGSELMIAVGPSVEETIAGLEGSVLKLSTSGRPWFDPTPDPAVNGDWQVRQALDLTCIALLRYPDKPAPDAWTLEPEAAKEMPMISADGRTYSFTIKPGFVFSPPSNEPVTAETFRATIERALSPVLDDGAPGPQTYGDIDGVTAYRAGTADHVAGLVAVGDRLTITLEAPAPNFLERLALPYICPVPAKTPVLRSGLNPDPPISGAGPYYLAEKLRKQLVVLKKNPNYVGPRAQPFDAIAIEMHVATAEALDRVQNGTLDGAMLDPGETVSDASSTLATTWGPGSANADAGDQRWFGAPGHEVTFIALNPSRPAFRDPDVRRAVSLALDRVAISQIWIHTPSGEFLTPGVAGAAPAAAAASPDVAAASALMKGRTFKVTLMGFPTAWQCGQCRDWESAITGQLKAIGITVVVRHPDDFPGGAYDAGSTVDLLNWGSGTDLPDPVSLLDGLYENSWLGKANEDEHDRLQSLTGQDRIDATVAFAHRISDEEALVVPTGYQVFPFFISSRIGCGFVQPAIGFVDLLSLCVKDAAAPTPSASP